MILIEVCSLLLKKIIAKLVSQLRSSLKSSLASFVATGALVAFLAFTSNVHAFSLDRPRVQSYIGQPLSVFIPINAAQNEQLDSNALVVARPSSEQIQNLGLSSADYESFQYQIVKVGETIGVLITSASPLKEPYVNLIVQVTYQGKTRIKPYPVLLDLPPSIPSTQNSLAQIPSNNASNASVESSTPSSQSNVITYSPEIMGAYDWAQKGAIPKKFGPVINGQSLWRVARRINKAMGVSIDQMAWGLYRANPNAFTSESVESLQAGSTLNIPEENFVRQVTELQAVRLLAEKQSAPNAQPSNEARVSSNTGSSDVSSDSSPSTEKEVVANETPSTTEDASPEFTMSGIESSQANQEVISTLNSTVAELSEQLLVRDQRITFLEKQIEQLTGIKPEDIAGNEVKVASDVAAVGDQTDLTDNAVVAIEEEKQSTVDEQQAEIENGEVPVVVENAETPIVSEQADDVDLATEAPSSVAVVSENEALQQTEPSLVDVPENQVASTSDDDFTEGASFWNWKKYLMLGLLALIAIAIFLRKTIAGFLSKLFSDEDEIVLNIPSVIDAQSRATAMESPFPDVVPEVVQASEVEEENEEDALADDFDDDFFLEDDESVDVEEMNLSDRIKQLLNAGNFGEAKKTIDFAHEANMDEKYLDFCRLKIFAAEQNKSEFAKTFNRVNRRINDFHPDIQFKIAELHREMFDSEAVIDFGFIEEED